MRFVHVPWVVAGIAVIAAVVLGWRLSAARSELRESQRKAEAELLKANGVLVAEQTRRSDVEKAAAALEAQNADLRSEIDRVARLIPGAKVDSAHHLVTGPVIVGGKPRPGSGRISPPAEPPKVEDRREPHSSRWRWRGSRRAWAAVPAQSDIRFASYTTSEAPEPATEPPSFVEPAYELDEAGMELVGGDARVPAQEGAASQADSAGAERCVLATGDTAEVVVDEVTLESKKGNEVVVGTAKVNRLKPEPMTTVIQGKFQADGSRVSRVSADRSQGTGWGVGAFGTLWNGGWTAGPVLALPRWQMLGQALDSAVMVGLGSSVQVGVMAAARF